MRAREVAEHLRKLEAQLRLILSNEAKEGFDGDIAIKIGALRDVEAVANTIGRAAGLIHPPTRHAEAYMLMLYRCELNAQTSAIRQAVEKAQGNGERPTGCGFEEWLWNSRDGVTPFGIECPKCGETMFHSDWERDIFAPKYKPLAGTRIFANGTREEALTIIGQRWQLMVNEDHGITKRTSFDDYVARALGDFPEGWPTVRKVE